MKAIQVVLVLALVSLLAAFAPFASASDVNPSVRLENYSLSVPQVKPGDHFAVTLVFDGANEVCAEKLSVQLSATYPLSIAGPDAQYVDRLCQGGAASNGTLTFDAYADPLASTGNYQIAVATVWQKTFLKYPGANTVSIRVQGVPELAASIQSSTPVDIHAGDDAVLRLRFDNKGTGYVTASHLTASSRGIEVKWGGSDAELGAIAPRSYASAALSVTAADSLAPGNYPLDLVVSYVAEDGSRGLKTFSFTVPVKPKAEFAVSAGDVRLPISETSLVSLTLTNTGSDEARKVKAHIRPVFPFSTDGTVRYVESLKPGESVPLVYSIPVDKQATEGNQVLSMTIEYEDKDGKKLNDSVDFSIYARPKSLLETVLAYWWVGALAVVAFVVRQRMQKKPAKG